MSRPEFNCRINIPRLHELRKQRRRSALAAKAALLEAVSCTSSPSDKQGHAATMKRLHSKVSAYANTLAAKHPIVFNRESPVPLKIGIRADLRRAYPKFSNKVNNMFLQKWCNTARYKSALVPGTPRYNLEGDVSGVVLEAEVAHLK